MATEEEERKAKAERAKKLLATRQKKAKAAASSAAAAAANSTASPSLTDIDAGTASARTSLSIDDRAELAPPPKGEARRKKAVKPEGGEDAAQQPVDVANGASEAKREEGSSEAAGTTDLEPAPRAPEEAATASFDLRKPTPPDTQVSSDLQETISLLIAERTDLQSRLAIRDAEISSAKADKKLLDEGRAIIARLEAEKGELDASVAALQSEAEGVKLLQAELSEARNEADALRQKQQEAAEALEAVQDERRAEIAEQDGKVVGLEKSLERAREREGGLEAEIGRLRQREVELKGRAEVKSSEAEALRKQLATHTEELESSRTDHSSLRKELETLSHTYSHLQTSHTTLSKELESLQTKHSSQSERLRAAESSLSTSQSELERASTSLSIERKRAEAAEKKRLALQGENDALVSQLEEVRGKVALVMEEKADLAGELDSARGQIKKVDIDQTVKRLEVELEGSSSRIRALTRQLVDLQTAYSILQKERDPSAGYLGSPNSETPSLPRTSNVNRTVDAILPANVRHKRQVSLTALKARMGSSSMKGGGLDALAEHPGGDRRQFGDEIMFCCPACEGDLITL